MKNFFRFSCSFICFVALFTHENAYASSANGTSTDNMISTWDFYTKYLANAKMFKGSMLANIHDIGAYRVSEYCDYTYYYQMMKERWSLCPMESNGSLFEMNGVKEYAETGKLEFERRLDVKSLTELDRSVYGYMLEALLSVPVLTSEGKIVFYHGNDYSCRIMAGQFGSMSDQGFDSPTWQIESATNTISLKKNVGDYFEFSCDFSPLNFEYKEPNVYCSLLTNQYLNPSINTIELTIDPRQLSNYDEYGEWQWNEQRDTLWVTSKGKGILNTCPIRFTIAVIQPEQIISSYLIRSHPTAILGDSIVTTLETNPTTLVREDPEFILTLESDCFEFCHEKMTAESGEKIYDINFNFGNGNIPLTFVSNNGSTENKCIAFGAYNRFKNTFDYEAKGILNQMKANNYCVVTLRDKECKFQSYVFRLEGLESLLANFE